MALFSKWLYSCAMIVSFSFFSEHMQLLRSIGRFFKRLFIAICIAYMVAWHNVYKEDDRILHEIELSMEEDHTDQATEDTSGAELVTFKSNPS